MKTGMRGVQFSGGFLYIAYIRSYRMTNIDQIQHGNPRGEGRL